MQDIERAIGACRVLKLAGAPPPPPGLTIDGVDLGPVLFQGNTKAHDCITFYNYPHAATAQDVINLSAMRCGDHKVYWWVAGSPPAGVKPGTQPEGKHPLSVSLSQFRAISLGRSSPAPGK